MKNAQAKTTWLKDYRPPAYTIDSTALHFDLHEDHAMVVANLECRRNRQPGAPATDTLVLDGSQLVLEGLQLDGKPLGPGDYRVDDETLTIPSLTGLLGRPPEQFRLRCKTRIEPQNNTALEGLYKSKKMFCTQCEAEGFRRITYYLDRPDVMSCFTTTITADAAKYPILLSNGNCIASGRVAGDNSRHWVTWEDPFRKPSYLFALVAGDLVSREDSFVTHSGRTVSLQIFVEEKDLDKTGHAMSSLKQAMSWDEKVYGREYDLDVFMIVAVDDFNMGAMENKGLNIFNTACVLAHPATTTDTAFQRVEAVVAHEYFHNWSGNRVTCRDWFQLSLKEGFTVFRDAEFSADMGSRTVKRVEDVTFLKTVQFAEDAGPMAHPVRPDSYMEISNFYTVTVYEKGAEVVRMISLLLGEERFRQGTDLYFQRHDGQAVTTEEFVRAMEEASGIDLGQFRRWYTQAGTPVLAIEGEYQQAQQQYRLRVTQHCPATPGQATKQPFHIPLRVGLLAGDGQEHVLRLVGEPTDLAGTDRVLAVTEAQQEFIFTGISSPPIPSLLRGFSAPVRLDYPYSDAELMFLMVHDSDGFNRWSSGQQLAANTLDSLLEEQSAGRPLTLGPLLLQAFEQVLDCTLTGPNPDKAMVAHLLCLPTESLLIEQATEADVDAIHQVREWLANTLAHRLEDRLAAIYHDNQSAGEFRFSSADVAGRALKNRALAYLMRTGKPRWLAACRQQYETATNMTDQATALRLLVCSTTPAGQQAGAATLERFYQQWRHEALVVNQWLAIQAANPNPGTLQQVKSLLAHEAYSSKNPNRVRSLVGVFCGQNHVNFHQPDGAGYEFLADQAMALDRLNPQIAARLLTPLTRWRKFDPSRQALMQAQLQRIKSTPELSKDCFEVVEKSTVQ